MLKTSDFYYDLPEELIAQTPVYPRDGSRLLVYDRKKDEVSHRIFRDIGDYLQKGDVLVVNNTKVYPARIYARTAHGGKAEILLLKRINLTDWEVLVKPGKKAKPGTKLVFGDGLLTAEVVDVVEEGNRFAGDVSRIPTMLNWFIVIMGLIPAILGVISVLIYKKYPITNQIRQEMKTFFERNGK